MTHGINSGDVGKPVTPLTDAQLNGIRRVICMTEAKQRSELQARLARNVPFMRAVGGPWDGEKLLINSRYYLLWRETLDDSDPLNSTSFPFDAVDDLHKEIDKRREQCLGYYTADYIKGCFEWEAFG